ncbi:hypothetical protein HanRHA438_Chr15g0696501 [Helianthus annuus]|nr:hypothetical protein HanRHA438_Chr15g0696501 [Helianthus annuus]
MQLMVVLHVLSVFYAYTKDIIGLRLLYILLQLCFFTLPLATYPNTHHLSYSVKTQKQTQNNHSRSPFRERERRGSDVRCRC